MKQNHKAPSYYIGWWYGVSVAHIQYIPRNMHKGFVVLCFIVVMQSFIMNSHEVFIHIHQGCFAGTGAIVRLPQCQWSKPDGYGKISRCITTTKHSKAKTVCIFLGIYCSSFYEECIWNNIWNSLQHWGWQVCREKKCDGCGLRTKRH